MASVEDAPTAVDVDHPLAVTVAEVLSREDDEFSEDSCEVVNEVFTSVKTALLETDDTSIFGPGASFFDEDPFAGVFREADRAPCAPVDPRLFEDVTEPVRRGSGWSETEPDGAPAAA